MKKIKHNILNAKHHEQEAKIIAENETGKIEIVYFRAKSEYLKSLYKVGDRITISGKVDIFNQKKQISWSAYGKRYEQNLIKHFKLS